MFRLVSVLLVVVAACTGLPLSSRILGGSDADIADFPYIVSIEQTFYGHHCGGAIISADWVLTDSWCTRDPADTNLVTVRSGSSLLGDGTPHNVIQWIHHPEHNVFDGVFDFALVQVDPPFEFGENVAALALPEQEEGTPDGAEAFISGWGRVRSSDEEIHNTLQFAKISTYNEARCSEYLVDDFQTSKLCAKDPNELVAHCYKDEGGPLVIDGKLFGIAQYPGTCAVPYEVLLFSRVASVRTWIDKTIAA